MDPLSENYNEQANVDDGSCVYARDKFIGSYNATETCTSGQYNWAMTIETIADDVTKVLTKNFGGFDFAIEALIDGNKITFDFDGIISGTAISIKGSGELRADGKTLDFTYNAKIPNFEDNCVVVAVKQ